jgi:hypothetical protein
MSPLQHMQVPTIPCSQCTCSPAYPTDKEGVEHGPLLLNPSTLFFSHPRDKESPEHRPAATTVLLLLNQSQDE